MKELYEWGIEYNNELEYLNNFQKINIQNYKKLLMKKKKNFFKLKKEV